MAEGPGYSVGEREMILNGTGRQAYLWIGPGDTNDVQKTIYTFSGQKTLRAFAKAILKATDPKPKRSAK